MTMEKMQKVLETLVECLAVKVRPATVPADPSEAWEDGFKKGFELGREAQAAASDPNQP